MGEEEHGMLAHAAQIGVHLLHPPSAPPINNPVRAFSGPPHLQNTQLCKLRRIFGAPACLPKDFPAVLPPSGISFPIFHIHNKGPYFPNRCMAWL